MSVSVYDSSEACFFAWDPRRRCRELSADGALSWIKLSQRSQRSQRSHCSAGHEYSTESRTHKSSELRAQSMVGITKTTLGSPLVEKGGGKKIVASTRLEFHGQPRKVGRDPVPMHRYKGTRTLVQVVYSTIVSTYLAIGFAAGKEGTRQRSPVSVHARSTSGWQVQPGQDRDTSINTEVGVPQAVGQVQGGGGGKMQVRTVRGPGSRKHVSSTTFLPGHVKSSSIRRSPLPPARNFASCFASRARANASLLLSRKQK